MFGKIKLSICCCVCLLVHLFMFFVNLSATVGYPPACRKSASSDYMQVALVNIFGNLEKGFQLDFTCLGTADVVRSDVWLLFVYWLQVYDKVFLLSKGRQISNLAACSSQVIANFFHPLRIFSLFPADHC